MTNGIVRAVDIGFGNTKFVTGHPAGGEIVCDVVPSLAPISRGISTIGGGVVGDNDVLEIQLNGSKHIVGKDADKFMPATGARILDPSYTGSDQYLALLRGALAYMNEPHIELLVLGLPISTFDRCSPSVKKLATGEHVVPNLGHRLNPEAPKFMTVFVESASVMQQPMGGFFDHLVRTKQLLAIKKQTALIVDVGFFTIDWIVVQEGKPNPSRSGGWNGGMSGTLRAIADAIERDQGVEIPTTSRVDACIRAGGTTLKIHGKETDIAPQLAAGKATARDYISVLASGVGTGEDIDNIILAGGGAVFFLAALQERYPRHEITVVKDPVFGNVRGFQLVGEDMLRRKRVLEQRAA
ncbi:MAG: PRTRC system protein D [Rhodocyclaceae bacterium]|nr:MAG: PRTRC system protein D [Rhodocyclaceae bacterium]